MRNLKNINNDSLCCKSQENQTGRSMIEMLGVLAIIGVLSVGGIAGYSKAMMKYRINKTIATITQISQNIRTYFYSQKNYNGLTCSHECGLDGECSAGKIIRKAKLVPDEIIGANNGAYTSLYRAGFSGNVAMGMENAFGGGIGIGTKNAGAMPEIFEIVITNLPEEACIDLVSQDWSTVSSGFVGFELYKEATLKGGAATSGNKASIADALSIPVSIDNAINICSSDKNNLAMYFE